MRLLLFALAGWLVASSASAQFPWQALAPLVPQTFGYSTWDPNINPTQVTLSGGDLTWTCTGCGTLESVGLGTFTHTIGKFHAEQTMAGTLSCCFCVGVTGSGAVADAKLGAQNHGVCYAPSGTITANIPVLITTLPPYVSGNTICEEVDGSNHLLWFRNSASAYWNPVTYTGQIAGTAMSVSGVTGTLVNGLAVNGAGVTAGTVIVGGSGSSWQVNHSQTVASEAMVGSGNPANSSGGINIAGLVTSVLYPGVSAGFTLDAAATLNVGATSFACPVSSGYVAWH